MRDNPKSPPNIPLQAVIQDTSEPLYRIPAFLSIATPYTDFQKQFLENVIRALRQALILPRTLGPSDQFTDTPLTSVRRMILSSYGALAIAFRKIYVPLAINRPESTDPNQPEQKLTDFWLSSPYLQIEPSMAYQQGLPLLILVERGVKQGSVLGGILEQGAGPFNLISFEIPNADAVIAFFSSSRWTEAFANWTGQVRSGYDIQTQPTFKYTCSY